MTSISAGLALFLLGYFIVSAATHNGSGRVVSKFETAWNKTDVEALPSLFFPRMQGRFPGYIKRQMKKHGWGNRLPELEEAELLHLSERFTRWGYKVGEDEL